MTKLLGTNCAIEGMLGADLGRFDLVGEVVTTNTMRAHRTALQCSAHDAWHRYT
jgi:hypothetical protein